LTPANFPYDPNLVGLVLQAVGEVFSHIKDQRDTGRLEEVVGLVLGEGKVVRLTNQARSIARFDIGPTQFDDAVASLHPSQPVLAFYHSHPTGNLAPSIEDQGVMRGHFSSGVYLPWLIATDEPSPRARLHWIDPLYDTIASYDLPVCLTSF